MDVPSALQVLIASVMGLEDAKDRNHYGGSKEALLKLKDIQDKCRNVVGDGDHQYRVVSLPLTDAPKAKDLPLCDGLPNELRSCGADRVWPLIAAIVDKGGPSADLQCEVEWEVEWDVDCELEEGEEEWEMDWDLECEMEWEMVKEKENLPPPLLIGAEAAPGARPSKSPRLILTPQKQTIPPPLWSGPAGMAGVTRPSKSPRLILTPRARKTPRSIGTSPCESAAFPSPRSAWDFLVVRKDPSPEKPAPCLRRSRMI
jgi:hypothetical protein